MDRIGTATNGESWDKYIIRKMKDQREANNIKKLLKN